MSQTDISSLDAAALAARVDRFKTVRGEILAQVGKVIDMSKAEVHRNGDWFGKMSFADVIQLCGKVTVAQMLTRDDFAKRHAAGTPIFMHECLYPITETSRTIMTRYSIIL